MQVPLNNIIERIKKETAMPEEEIKTKINEKIEELAGLVSEEGAAHIVANELNVKIFSEEPQEVKVIDIKPFMKNLKVTGKITNVYDLISFEKNSNPGKVRTCLMGDDTGRIRATFWHGATDVFETVKEGDILRISRVSSRENNGRSELSVSSAEQVEINPEGVDIEVSMKMADPKVKKIAELGEEKYASLLGIIVQSLKPNFFYSCPDCRRRVKQEGEKSFCDIHGEVEANLGCVINVVLDDGTGTIRCVLFNEQFEKLIEQDQEYIKKLSKDEKEVEQLQEVLIGKIVKVIGALRSNSFSGQVELVVNKILTDVNISEEL